MYSKINLESQIASVTPLFMDSSFSSYGNQSVEF